MGTWARRREPQRKYNSTAVATDGPWTTNLEPQPHTHQRQTRGDALNYAVAGFFGSCGLEVIAWLLLPNKVALLPIVPVVLFPFAAGAGLGAWKLVKFTEEARNWIYAVEAATHTDLDGDGEIGKPPPGTLDGGTMLIGGDGQHHRIGVALTELEIAAIKAYVLSGNKCSVRGLTPIIGDNASLLRSELNRIGVLGELRDSAPTPLTPGGVAAVERW